MSRQRCVAVCGKRWIFVLIAVTLTLTLSGIFHEDIIYRLVEQEKFLHAEGKNISHTINYIIPNVNICTIHQPYLLIWIYSAPDNLARRNAIRNTWGNITLYQPIQVRVVFSLAKIILTDKQGKIFKEQEEFGDLVQDGSFIDAYRNLTYKAQSMLIWTDTYCSGVKLLLKLDDDSFISPKRMKVWLDDWRLGGWPSNSVIGNLWRYPKPIRRPSKWRITKKDWPERVFAKKGCPGGGYFITGDAIHKLRDAINTVRFLWIEDMYVTGILAQKAQTKHIDISTHIYHIYDSKAFYQVTNKERYFLVSNIPNTTVQYKLWRALESSAQKLGPNLLYLLISVVLCPWLL